MEKVKHVRFYRCSYIVGWEPLDTGLLLIYSDGQREVVEMPAKEADENCQFLCDELSNARDFIGIAWEDEDKLG